MTDTPMSGDEKLKISIERLKSINNELKTNADIPQAELEARLDDIFSMIREVLNEEKPS